MGRWVAFLFLWWVVLYLFWLLLVDVLAPPEVVVGLGAAALAVLPAAGIRVHGGRRFRARWRWLALLRAVPWSVARDSAVVLAVLWRRLVRRERVRGRFRIVRFPAGDDDQEAATWRAFAIAATSVAPNTYVVGIDSENKTALVHQLVPDPPQKVRASVVGAGSHD